MCVARSRIPDSARWTRRHGQSIALALLLLASAHSPFAQNVTNQDFVRNGQFDLASTSPGGYPSGWHTSTFHARVADGVDPQGGPALRLDADDEGSWAYQELHLPDLTTSASLSLRLRVINRYDNLPPQPGSLINPAVAVVPFTQDEQLDVDNVLISGFLLDPAAAGPGNWMQLNVPFASDAVAALNQARAQNQRVALYFWPAANNTRQSVLLDNIELRLNGNFAATGQGGEIVFVSGADVMRMAPDASAPQALWSHPGADPEVSRPRWNAQGTEVAFISDHELPYSQFTHDIYAIGASGGPLRRVSNAPSQAELLASSLPVGSVRVTLTNNYNNHADSVGPMFVYVRGASDLSAVSLPAFGQSTQITIPGVRRFLAGPQYIVLHFSSNACGLNRRHVAGQVNVVPGQTVDVSISFNGSGCSGFRPRAQSLTWSRTSSELGYTLVSAPYKLAASGSSSVGSEWWSSAAFVNAPDWSPSDERVLFDTLQGVYVRNLASASPPTLLIPAPAHNAVWLPDASGMLYASSADIHQANAQGGNRQRLTVSARDEFFESASASPDGSWLVIERNIGGQRTLWLRERSNPANMRMLAEGRYPDWSRGAVGGGDVIFQNGFQ